MQYLWNQPTHSDLQPPKSNEGSEVCSICLENPGTKNVSITACGHKFCTSCLLKSLQKNNTCPMCRTELEPKRSSIAPITVSQATALIREEEQIMDVNSRISLIQSFSGTNGRSSMIFSLCREVAFATAHAIARWQNPQDSHNHNGTTYDDSWMQFDTYESDNE